jgi:hypothetical protein
MVGARLLGAQTEEPASWILTGALACFSAGRHVPRSRTALGLASNTAGKLGWLIDTRAAGGYVLAAGSAVGGRPYVDVHDRDPAPLPEWLAALLTAEPPRPAPASARQVLASLERPAGYAGAALRGEVQPVLDSGPGEHNNTLYKAALALGQLVGGGLLPRQRVEEALRCAGEAVGQPPREAAATVNSGLRTGQTRPRGGAA